VHCLIETRNGVLYSGTGPFGKIFKSTDQGRNWIKTAPGPGVMKVYSLVEIADGTVFAGTYPKGDVFKTTDAGLTWLPVSDIPNVTTVSKLIAGKNGLIYAATYPSDENNRGLVFKTTDRGASWHQLSPIPDVVGGVRTLFQTGSGTIVAGCYSGSSSVYLSSDQGLSWTLVSLPIHEARREEWSQICFIRETAPKTLYAGGWTHGSGQGGYIWKSTDDGMSWDTTASRIQVDNVKATKVYDLVKTGEGVLIAGFQSYPDSVVALSSDDGKTWKSAGMLGGADETLCLLETDDGSIFAGTAPHGDVFQYQSASGVQGQAGLMNDFRLFQNYPNPFNASTAVVFQIPKNAGVKLDIVDMLGKTVSTLVNENRPAGTYMTVWHGVNGSGHPMESGVYLCRLTCGELFQTKKLLLLR
jgi:photosystem II stability/assembly factor-like uncharacterized protein